MHVLYLLDLEGLHYYCALGREEFRCPDMCSGEDDDHSTDIAHAHAYVLALVGFFGDRGEQRQNEVTLVSRIVCGQSCHFRNVNAGWKTGARLNLRVSLTLSNQLL